MENNEEPLLPELKDIREMINRYNVAHPQGCFIYRFVGYKKADEPCEECGDDCVCYDETRSDFGVCGDIETIRNMLNELRDMSEDFKDDEGIVII
jgi:hypothetical protein